MNELGKEKESKDTTSQPSDASKVFVDSYSEMVWTRIAERAKSADESAAPRQLNEFMHKEMRQDQKEREERERDYISDKKAMSDEVKLNVVAEELKRAIGLPADIPNYLVQAAALKTGIIEEMNDVEKAQYKRVRDQLDATEMMANIKAGSMMRSNRCGSRPYYGNWNSYTNSLNGTGYGVYGSSYGHGFFGQSPFVPIAPRNQDRANEKPDEKKREIGR